MFCQAKSTRRYVFKTFPKILNIGRKFTGTKRKNPYQSLISSSHPCGTPERIRSPLSILVETSYSLETLSQDGEVKSAGIPKSPLRNPSRVSLPKTGSSRLGN